MNVVIVDYGMGNLRSIQRKLLRHGVNSRVGASPQEIAAADRLIFPGVGHFAAGMTNLRQSGLLDVLNERVMVDRTPIMGICLGMQLFSKFSEEGGAEGLGWIDARTVKFRGNRTSSTVKVPHVGWNTFRAVHPSRFFEGVREDQKFYYTHSYHLECADPADVLAVTGYGYEFTSAVRRDNIFGVQFHPEKSHLEGLQVLLNFVNA
jgi:glutamine amidotransferase